MIDSVAEHREDLEALAERSDLRCSRYAEALLEMAETGTKNGTEGDGRRHARHRRSRTTTRLEEIVYETQRTPL